MFRKFSEAKKKVKIDVENPGVLEVPEDKKFWQLPLSHFEKLVDKKGYAKVIRALTNLEVWNKNDDPDISKKASDIADKLKKKFKKESLERSYKNLQDVEIVRITGDNWRPGMFKRGFLVRWCDKRGTDILQYQKSFERKEDAIDFIKNELKTEDFEDNTFVYESRKRRNESLDISKEELLEIVSDTEAESYIDEDSIIKDSKFKSLSDEYSMKTFGLIDIISKEDYESICRDTAYALKSALGDDIGDFFNEDEYFRYMLKDFSYVKSAYAMLERLDDSFLDKIDKIIDDFKYNDKEYIIIKTW